MFHLNAPIELEPKNLSLSYLTV